MTRHPGRGRRGPASTHSWSGDCRRAARVWRARRRGGVEPGAGCPRPTVGLGRPVCGSARPGRVGSLGARPACVVRRACPRPLPASRGGVV